MCWMTWRAISGRPCRRRPRRRRRGGWWRPRRSWRRRGRRPSRSCSLGPGALCSSLHRVLRKGASVLGSVFSKITAACRVAYLRALISSACAPPVPPPPPPRHPLPASTSYHLYPPLRSRLHHNLRRRSTTSASHQLRRLRAFTLPLPPNPVLDLLGVPVYPFC